MVLKFKKTAYSPLGQDDDPDAASLERLLPQQVQEDDFLFVKIRKRSWHYWVPSALNAVFLCFSVLFFLYSINIKPTDIQCGRQLSTYCG